MREKILAAPRIGTCVSIQPGRLFSRMLYQLSATPAPQCVCVCVCVCARARPLLTHPASGPAMLDMRSLTTPTLLPQRSQCGKAESLNLALSESCSASHDAAH